MAGEKKGTWKKKKSHSNPHARSFSSSPLSTCPIQMCSPAVALAGAPQALAVTGTQIKIQFLP